MSDTALGAETERAVRLIDKLLTLAAKNTNAEEAAAATAKAHELLALHNLDLSSIEQGGGDSGKREDAKLQGGAYQWQRDLWGNVADLNFCMYFNNLEQVEREVRSKAMDGTPITLRKRRWVRQHRIVGRRINVRVTRQMGEYIETSIDRILRARVGYSDGRAFYSKWAYAFRQGAAAQVMERIYDKRRDMLDRERAEREARDRAARAASMAGVSTATGLTISDVKKSEHDANIDYLYGPGTSARWAAQRAARAAAEAEAERQYTEWAAANPEEAAKQAKEERDKERRNAKRRTGRYSFGKVKEIDSGAYASGYEAAKSIGLDTQVQENSSNRIGHGK